MMDFFQWSTGDSTSQISFFSSSLISLEHTSQFGCVSSDTISLDFLDYDTADVSIPNNASFGFSVFPNRVKHYLFLILKIIIYNIATRSSIL